MIAAEFAEAVQSLPLRTPLLGLDLGSKTIGVALSDITRQIASPLETIARKKFTVDAARLIEIAEQHKASLFVLGLPLNMDGSEGPRAQSTRAFARNLAKLTPIPIAFWDERLSTAAVERMLIEADRSRKKRAEIIDKLAAAYILQSALDSLPTLMLAAFESLLPVFMLMGLGFVLRWRGIIPADMWRGLELLGYWVFFPALLSLTLIRADLSSLPLTGIMLTMAATYFTMAGLLILFRREIMRRLAIGGPSFSSIFQNATRWNGFIALPILAKLHGEMGVALVAVVMGVLVPIANFCAVYVVAQNADARKLSTFETLYLVFRNPFIWATAIGLLINLAKVPIYDPIMTILDMLGGAAIASGLLMVGAGLRAEEIRKPSPAVWLGTGLKLFATPLFVTLWSFVFGIEGVPFLACIVCAAVPTAMSAYVLARQMGGDAPLVATTVTLQTAISFVSIPVFIFLAQTLR